MSTETHTSDGSTPGPIRQLTDTHREILRYIRESPNDPHLRNVHSHLVAIESEPYSYSPEWGSCEYNDERWEVKAILEALQATGLIEARGHGLGWHLTNTGTLLTQEIDRAD